MGLIFSIDGHIAQIRAGTKTVTRRPAQAGDEFREWTARAPAGVIRNGRLLWREGQEYAVIPKRGQKGVGKICLIKIHCERVRTLLPHEAQAEGGYTPAEYDRIWETMYGERYEYRWVLHFRYLGEAR